MTLTLLPSMENITTITIRKETKQKLASLGKKDESYDSIVNRILEPLVMTNQ
jgi:hypothetical protein